MKKVLSIIAILALVISVSSCGNKKKKSDEHVGTHSHEDGTVHADDAHKHAAPVQEAFEVKADNDAEHKHEGGDHDHDGHKHENGDVDAKETGHDKDELGHEHGDEAGHDHDQEHGEHK
jgi:zinc transport system substrate-binding protein